MDRGFDESLIHGGGVVGEAPDYWDNNYYDDVYFRNGQPERVKGYCTDVWFNETIQFVEKNKDRPLFIYLPTNAAHAPFHVPEKYVKPYASQKGRAAFYGMIANIDENLGKLRVKLNELSLERDTILVFFNDNGTSGGVALTKDARGTRNGWEVSGYNAGMRGRKTSPYEGGHRAACFIHWPKESNLGIRAEAPADPMHPATHRMKEIPCKVVNVVEARLKVGRFDKTVTVNESDQKILFELDLSTGEQRIQTWFTMENGEQTAAYYIYIEPVSLRGQTSVQMRESIAATESATT